MLSSLVTKGLMEPKVRKGASIGSCYLISLYVPLDKGLVSYTRVLGKYRSLVGIVILEN